MNKTKTTRIEKRVKEKEGYLPRVWVSVEKKIQIQNYEPISLQAGLSIDVEENETIQEVYDKCFKEIKKALIPQVKQLYKIKNK